MNTRFGIGYDVHRLMVNRKLIIGGVEIPFIKGLVGHSDADVLCHAIADALLGAAALGDIGVAGLMRTNNYEIVNVDATVVLQAPKIGPYIKRMRENLSQAMGIHEGQVSVKATTSEELGFIGMGDGAAVYAIAAISGNQTSLNL